MEGTILTVLREASEAARDHAADVGDDLADLMRRVYERGVDALERTPDMLPVLKQAGVVDAGGAGFLLLLASFLEVVTGTEVDLPERVLRARADISAIEPRSVERDRRLDRGRRGRWNLELSHPHRSHRPIDRGRHRRRHTA